MALPTQSSNRSSSQTPLSPPVSEKVKGIFGFFGIRLDESPEYKLIEKQGPVEIRAYEGYLIAEVSLKAQDYRQATEEAFKILASYIFGGNSSQEQMPMTTPVFRQWGDSSLTMSFVMPLKHSIATLPKPQDKQIKIKVVPAEIVAILRYSGSSDEAKMEEKSKELLKALEEKGSYRAIEKTKIAQYDAPYIIPFLKRNEVQVAVIPNHQH